MSSKSLSLEDLEARCDMLQRRVNERSGHSVTSSPPRPANSSGLAYSPAASRTVSSPIASARMAQATAANNGTSRPQPVNSDHPLNFHDISTALSQLERERTRLQEQLAQTDTHIRAYRQLQQIMVQNPNAVTAAAQNTTSASYQAPANRNLDTSNISSSSMGSPRRAAPVSAASPSPTRHVSPRRGMASSNPSVQPSAATLQTEQIYEELRQIRKAREEREAQRRAQANAAVSSS